MGGLFGALGMGLLARAASNQDARRLVGAGDARRGIDIRKSLDLAVPADTVFEFWRNIESFPRFMSNVRQVRDLGSGRSQWTVAGPAGVPVEWEAEITQLVPNQMIAWKTVPGSSVDHTGSVRFSPNPDGTTRIEVCMAYAPPAGALGHAVASLFGADPKSEIDADLMRMKTLIETGQPPRDAAQAGQAEAEPTVH
jgi:uncharacterized membrane protein